ncbi:hypothetical protein VTN77DRAFT_4604 [Rasamsonia byssochlamydoides]|uniref:uncharacterized protein n=1 Tax=Rasamsonia byssochlamydoides TaxID=89139 RepID=UPI0037426619
MAANAEQIAQQNAAIKQQLATVIALAEQYEKLSTQNAGKSDVEGTKEVSSAHTALCTETQKLLRTVRGPLDFVWSHFENVANTSAVRAVLEMGVFEALPKDCTPMKASDLAERLKVEKDLLVRLMRMASVIGPFQETGPEEFAHTPYSLIYLVPEIDGIFKCLVDEYMPAEIKFHEFFRLNGWASPVSATNNPYTFAHRTEGKDMWEYMAQFPERLKNFNYAMVAQNNATFWTVSLFPFYEELSKYETTEETPLVVDVGGGKGHVSRQIRQLCKDLKGRVILQDRPEALSDVIDGLENVELMEYDFFTPQPIKGAHIYYIRRCLHDWPDATCVQILKNIASAMQPGDKRSRIVIAECILPDVGTDVEGCWMDLTMMTLTGGERTRSQWTRILEEAGLQVGKFYTAPGTNYGAVEAWLP